jgi:divalent metal cation (Fe/Co/Zn/Cd) transporter
MADPQNVRGHVTIEKTGKRLKFQQLLAVMLIITGFFVAALSGAASNGNGKPPESITYGIGAAAIGFVWYVVVRIMRWWQHG